MYYTIFTFQFAYNWFSGGASSFAKTPFDLAVCAMITINTAESLFALAVGSSAAHLPDSG